MIANYGFSLSSFVERPFSNRVSQLFALIFITSGVFATYSVSSASTGNTAESQFSAVAAGVTLPGPRPGVPKAELGPTIRVGNNAFLLELAKAVDSQVFVPIRLTNYLSGRTIEFKSGRFFTATIRGQGQIKDSALRMIGQPRLLQLPAQGSQNGRLSDRSPGIAVNARYSFENAGVQLVLDWSLVVRRDANYATQLFRVTPVTGEMSFDSVTFAQGVVNGARVLGSHDGNPVVLGNPGAEDTFIGLENPMARATLSPDGMMALSLPARLPITGQTPFFASVSIGVSQPGQLRRSFNYYVQRERISRRRTYLHYQSWYDNRIDGDQLVASQLQDSIQIVADELTRRKVRIDGYFIDSGWDYKRKPRAINDDDLNVWDFDPTQFPEGFRPELAIAKSSHSGIGVWMSPFGGYDTALELRQALNSSKPVANRFETTDGGLFRLSGPIYFNSFRAHAFRMLDKEGVNAFKLDGIGGGLDQSGPNVEFIDDYESLLRLSVDLHRHKPDLWINATVGTWASPYWLWYVDSIWRDGRDVGAEGQGSAIQKNITYQAKVSYASRQMASPLFPITSLMTHGFIFSDRENGPWDQVTNLSNEQVIFDLRSQAKAYFGLGLGLQELYIRPTLDRKGVSGHGNLWDAIARYGIWGRKNQDLLTDSRFIGRPGDGHVYGSASWNSQNGGQGILVLRNPGASRQTFSVNPAQVFELPAGYSDHYQFVEIDNASPAFVAASDSTYDVDMRPFEVLIFEAKRPQSIGVFKPQKHKTH